MRDPVTGRLLVSARGEGGNDEILGNAGADQLFGGGGDDLIDGGADADEIEAGAGFDVVYGGSGADVAYGGAQDDILFGQRDPAGATFGQAGDTGDSASDGDDRLFGEEGNDFLRGQAGADEVWGGRGADIGFGDAGDDKVYGEAGGDILFGGAGNDFVDGSEGADVAFGDDGLVGYKDFDASKPDFTALGSRIRFIGGAQVIGDADASALTSFAADAKATSVDLMLSVPQAGDGSDTVVGGSGDDILFGGGGTLDRLYGDYDPVAGFTGPRPNGQDIAIGDGGRIEWQDRRVSRAAAQSNTLDGQDEVSGNDGADYLFGGGRQDTLQGFQAGTGVMPLDGVSDNDVILGDNGEILFDTSDSKNRVEQIRTVTVPGDSGASDMIDGDYGDDVILGGLNSSSDTLTGDVGDDIILGDNGELVFDADGNLDTLDRVESFADSLGGDDVISGNDGADLLIGGTGGDTMGGDAGEDILLGDNGRIDLAGASGRLQVQVAAMPAATAVDRIRTTDTSASTGGADVMEGNGGADVLFGGVAGDTMLGDGTTVNNAADEADVLVGDNGELDFTFGTNTDRSTLDLVRSAADGLGGVDTLSGNAGSDILAGGAAGDLLWGDSATAQAGAADGGDVLLGDNGDITTRGEFGAAARLTVLGTGIAQITTTDTTEGTGGADTLSGQAGADVIAGGVAGDLLYGDALTVGALDGDDVLLGDNGRLRLDADLQPDLSPAAGFDLRTLDRVETFTDGLGGADTISGQRGRDVAFGGTGGDTVFGDDALATSAAADGGDILLGDNGVLQLVDPALDASTPASGSQRVLVLGGAAASLRSTDEGGPATGGGDTISGNAGGDIVLGGVAGDTLYGDRSAPAATNADDGADILLGDNGQVEWLSAGRLAEITGIDLASTNANLVAGFAVRDANLDTIDLITTEQPNNGGRDTVYGGNERDLILGGTDADLLYGDTGSETDGTQSASGNDLIFGDHGRLYPQFSRSANAVGALVASPAIHSRNFFAIDTGASAGGEGDRLWGEEGADILIGQQGDDRIWGGSGDDDLIGGHNLAGGADELGTAGGVAISIGTDAFNDAMDGGGGNDALAGDNATVWRRGDSIDPRYRTLTDSALYTVTGEASVAVNVDSTHRADPDGTVGRDITLRDHGDGVAAPLWGRDIMAGGAGADALFGQMGNDLMQGDGLLGDVAKSADPASLDVAVADSGLPSTAGDGSLAFNVPEAATDGRDYMEGNAGNDLMYGGLGQDDMVGGSSNLFGLTSPSMRPDGGDTIFGGAGVRLSRLDAGDLPGVDTAAEFARDADQIAGDNATIHRIVTTGGAFATFNYDTYNSSAAGEKILVRAVRLLDYTLGGPDYAATAQAGDRGAGDHIRGEAGNDFIHGMAGSDVLFGDGQDDDLIGGYGHDWVSGGSGQDGIVGDDGLIRTSRNSSTVGEPLQGVAPLLARDPSTRESNGNVVGEAISTPGGIQTATIHVAGELLKSVDLTPLSVDPAWQALDDEFGYGAGQGDTPYADDILYGGIGSDWLHGGSGDDAISGAEALPEFFNAAAQTRPQFFGPAPTSQPSAGTTGGSSINPGNVLRFNPTDTDGTGPNRERAGEFALYDEYNPMREVRVSSTDGWSGSLVPTGGSPFILNFAINEGVKRASETVSSGGNSTITTGEVWDDGQDKIFGNTGNDWLAGGTGRDNLYGGWGNDLLNADDNLSTASGLNNQPDTHSSYEDRAFGGAGRDVLIGNTGGDRLIDWVGEWNSYLVPFAPFGAATVSRTLQPQLPEFLTALSRADGADPTRGAYTGDPRNGEPKGELGLVLQKDQAWQDQTGAPADPQAGNIPGGQRDVLRSADFTGNQSQGFVAESGAWTVTNGRYEVRPNTATGTTDAVSLFYVDQSVPTYFEVAATINAVKPTAGFRANAYVVFDYVSPTNFKFAGINISTNKVEIGQRTAAGWQVMSSINALLKQDTDYNTLLAVNGNAVTFVVNNTMSVSYTFAPRTDADGFAYSIRDGMVGLAGNNARARIDNVRVQVIPPAITYKVTDTFSAAASTLLTAHSGSFGVQSGRLVATPATGSPAAVAGNDIGVSVYSLLKLDTAVRTSGVAGVVFDMYSTTDFKWAGVSAATGQVLIGHYNARAGWVVDAAVARTVSSTADQTLSVTLKGSTVSVTLNGQAALSFSFNANVVDGGVGVFARNAAASFDSFGLSTDDPAFAGVTATAASTTTSTTTARTLSATSSDSTMFIASTSPTGWSTGADFDARLESRSLRDLFTGGGLAVTWTGLGNAQAPAPAVFAGVTSAPYALGADRISLSGVEGVSVAASGRSASAAPLSAELLPPEIRWAAPVVTDAVAEAATAQQGGRLWQESFVTDLARAAKPSALPDLRITI
jgi:Ca2+-binding RTX toxin-like protein